jgi:hypothetical protein
MPSTDLYRFRSLPPGLFHDLIVQLDLVDPGLLGWLTRLNRDRQQVMFAVLSRAAGHLLSVQRLRSSTPLIAPDLSSLKPLTAEMRQGRSRDLIQAQFGSCPDGFLGALARVPVPQPVIFYSKLHQVLSNPNQVHIAKVVRHIPALDIKRLAVLLTLDPVILVPRFARKVKSLQEAEDLNVAVRLIREQMGFEACDAALRNSVNAISDKTTVGEWLTSWFQRVGRVTSPALDLGSGWAALDTGKKLSRVAIRLQNCLSSPDRLVGALAGCVFYYANVSRGLVVEVQPLGLNRTLVLAGIYGRGNMHVLRRVREEVEALFLAAGVPTAHCRSRTDPWRAVERLMTPTWAEDWEALRALEDVLGAASVAEVA